MFAVLYQRAEHVTSVEVVFSCQQAHKQSVCDQIGHVKSRSSDVSFNDALPLRSFAAGLCSFWPFLQQKAMFRPVGCV